MKPRPMPALFSAVLLLAGASAALAESALTPKAQYETDSKKALARYEDDKKLCNDETSSNARLQCRRDAKTEYDKAIVDAKARMGTAVKDEQSRAGCADCGKVVSVQVSEKEGEGSAVGMVAGGVAGALLGQQLGGGLGKDLATVAGAVGGAYAGKEIEKKVKTHKVWIVGVQYKDGSRHSFEFKEDPGLAVGDSVRKAGDSIVRY